MVITMGDDLGDDGDWLDGKLDDINSVSAKRKSVIRVFVATVRETLGEEQRRVFVALCN